MSNSTLAPDQDSVNPPDAPPDDRLTANAPANGHVVIPPANASANLVRRIAESMLNAGEVTKNRENKDQHYKFASAEDILAAVRRPLLERSILLTQRPRIYDEQTITSNRGTAGTLLTITIDFTFRCGMTGEVLVIEDWRGQGQDYGDKAYGKAFTNAAKTFIRAQWLLPTAHDDPEASDPGERMARNGNAHAPAIVAPAWAAPANADAKRGALEALTEIIGDRAQAGAYAKALAAKCDGFPDVVAKWIASLPEWVGTKPESEAEAARAAQDAAAETPPPAPEFEREPVEGPPPGYVAPPDPGTVPLPSLSGASDEAAATKIMRDVGCTCEQPFSDTDHDAACPIQGHGTVIEF